jgi:hypothetical protein
VAAPLLLQTEDGDQNAGDQRSTSGFAVGNITVRTDGAQFWVGANSANGNVPFVAEGTVEQQRREAGIPGQAERPFTCKGGLSLGSRATP